MGTKALNSDSFSGARGRAGGYQIDLLVQGYPGKSVCHGSLGWSTIALLRGRVGCRGGSDHGARRTELICLTRPHQAGYWLHRGYGVTDVCHHDAGHCADLLFPRSRLVATQFDVTACLRRFARRG